MRCHNFNINEVAADFWDKPDTLKEYATLTHEQILQRNTCYYCKPPQTPDKWPTFCSLNHAICYYNNGPKQK